MANMNIQRPSQNQPVRKLATAQWKPMCMTEDQAEATWKKLEAAIARIHQQNASQLSFEELYRSAYNMVLHRHGPKLYAGMECCLREHLARVSGDFEAKSDVSFVKDVLAKWHAYHKSTQMIRDILMYMDRTYVKHFNRVPVFERGMEIWTAEIVRKPEIGAELRKLLLEQVSKERGGEAVQRDVLLDVTKMLLELGKDVYVKELEEPLLAASKDFFQGEVQRCLSSTDCPQYFLTVEQRLAAEQERAAAFLDAGTLPKLLKLVEDVFIRSQLETVLSMENSGFVSLVEADQHSVLRRVYTICRRIAPEGPAYLRGLLLDHVKDVGKALTGDSEAAKDPVVFTQKVLDLRDKYVGTITEAFAGDRQFLQALNQAFETFLNAFPRSPEYVSLYIDHKLRKGLASATDTQADEMLDKVLQVFRYLQDKDMFERYYKQHLSKRLLAARVTNDDVERVMLSKLKTECGYQFTSKLESMFMDIKTSQDTMAAFRQHVADNNIQLPADIAVQVLTTGSWPSTAGQPCALPLPLEACTRVFQDFYDSKHNGRQLAWHTAMGTADLKVAIQGKPRQITVTTHQMCVLMLLNDAPELTFRDFAELTQIPREDLKRALIGMTLVKGKNLLRKVPMEKDMSDTDVFSFNDKFDSKMMKIKFMAAGAQKEVDIDRGTRQKVEEDRKHIIEAAIVRIMKARRVLDYNSIITEVTRQMSGRFVPVAVDIKKRIESLIEREFIERDQTDRKMYRYVA